jgi:hypothetical protein
MFIRLRDGLDVRLRTAEKATEYFNRYWPADLPWPASARQLSTSR